MIQNGIKHTVKRLMCIALVLYMSSDIVFGSATESQAKSESITKTCKIPAYTQYGIQMRKSQGTSNLTGAIKYKVKFTALKKRKGEISP